MYYKTPTIYQYGVSLSSLFLFFWLSLRFSGDNKEYHQYQLPKHIVSAFSIFLEKEKVDIFYLAK